jgi:cystathionine beta-synthase
VWNETPLGEILAAKLSDRLIASWTSDRMVDVIASLKENDVSQVPVLHPDGTLAGLVSEVELLQHMVNGGHRHTPDETIAELVRPTEAIFSVSTPLESALPAITQDQAVLVTEADRPIGILTKIDILDFISERI